jgi:asparagine synthase (glutamine-hydrolysing)
MCGIFFFISDRPIQGRKIQSLTLLADKIKHRGPDSSRTRLYSTVMARFHRLEIVDPQPEGMQPFERTVSSSAGGCSTYAATERTDSSPERTDSSPERTETPDEVWMCMINGEIYNYRDLRTKVSADYIPKSHSDCEVVFCLFLTELQKSTSPYEALCKTLLCLDGEYAIVLYNVTHGYTIAVTDELRSRPLFIGIDKGPNSVGHYIVSEQKASAGMCLPLCPGVIYTLGYAAFGKFTRCSWDTPKEQLPPVAVDPWSEMIVHSTYIAHAFKSPIRWHDVPRSSLPTNAADIAAAVDNAADTLRGLLIANVHAKMHSDRGYGFLLSGGIDSSLICGIAARYCRDHELPRIRTFTVGFSRSAPDIIAARKVAAHIDSVHEEIIVGYNVGIDMISDVIKALESWDQTTVRASIPMMIAARYIKLRHPGIAVIYSGEVADELLRGYLYNRKSVTEAEAREDMRMRLQDISMFDGLRADRVIASQGMEVRFPFFSRALLKFAFSLPWELLDPTYHKGTEKWLLRKAFDGSGLIPQSIIWRTKNAFSDATSVMIGGGANVSGVNVSGANISGANISGESTSANTNGESSNVNSAGASSNPQPQQKSGGSEWKEMLKAHAELHVTAERFERRGEIYPGAQIQTREDMYYRDIFDSHGYSHEAIPYKWLPSWVDGATDSSATMLNVFSAN